MFVLICWGSEGVENKDWTKVIQLNGKQPIILNRIILMRNILQDKVTQISAREVGFLMSAAGEIFLAFALSVQ